MVRRLAFYLYCKIPFWKIHLTNPEIIEFASCIGRTPSAFAIKMCNLVAHDSNQQMRGVKGLAHRCKIEEISGKNLKMIGNH